MDSLKLLVCIGRPNPVSLSSRVQFVLEATKEVGEQASAIAEYDKKNPGTKQKIDLDANIFDNSGNIMNQMSEADQQKARGGS